MEGGGGSVGPFANVIVAVVVMLIVPAIVILAIYRGERARRGSTEGVIAARTRRTYRWFLAWGAFFVVFVAGTLIASKRSFTEQQGMAAFGAIFLGLPATLVILVGLFNALMVWRVPRVRILLIVTAILVPLVVTDLFREPWTSALAAAYGLVVLFVSLQGLDGLRRGAVS